MYLAFYKGRGRWFDRAIRVFTRGPYSHVELVMTKPVDGAVFTGLSASGRAGGVGSKGSNQAPENGVLGEVPWVNSASWVASKRFIGQPYDFVGILLSQVFPFRRHERGAWFCSELCAYACGFDVPQIYSPNGLHHAVLARLEASPDIEI